MNRISKSGNKILLVGINAYRGCPLRGCIADCDQMSNLLTNDFSLDGSDIVRLHDNDATIENIKDALRWLCDVQPGKTVVYHQSGHGVQVPCSNESDKMAEAFCPIGFDWTPESMITDKQFIEIFSHIPKGVKFYWMSDSCHSGDLERSVNPHPRYPRAYPTPLAIKRELSGRRHQNAIGRSISDGTLDVGYISGCKSDQTSSDAFIDGKYRGAFTYYFANTVHNTNKNTPLASVVAKTAEALRSNGYSQEPQLGGNKGSVPFILG